MYNRHSFSLRSIWAHFSPPGPLIGLSTRESWKGLFHIHAPMSYIKTGVKTHSHAALDCSVKQLVRKACRAHCNPRPREECCCDKRDQTAQDDKGQTYQMESKVHMYRYPSPRSQTKSLDCRYTCRRFLRVYSCSWFLSHLCIIFQ